MKKQITPAQWDERIPFSEEQINFIIDNSFSIGILLDGQRTLESDLVGLTDREGYNFRPEEQEELIQCLKTITKRRYAETIKDQDSAFTSAINQICGNGRYDLHLPKRPTQFCAG